MKVERNHFYKDTLRLLTLLRYSEILLRLSFAEKMPLSAESLTAKLVEVLARRFKSPILDVITEV